MAKCNGCGAEFVPVNQNYQGGADCQDEYCKPCELALWQNELETRDCRYQGCCHEDWMSDGRSEMEN